MKEASRLRTLTVLVGIAFLLSTSAALEAYTSYLPVTYHWTSIGTLGGDESRAYDINNAGQVVGYCRHADGSREAVIWNDTNDDNVCDPGEVNSLGTLGGSESGAYGINESGQVTGWSWTTGDATHEAMLWTDSDGDWQYDPGELTGLGDLGGDKSRAYGINDSGQVTGFSLVASGRRRAMRWTDGDGDWSGDPGEMVNLGGLGGVHTFGFGINSVGHVVGESEVSDGVMHAFRWVDGDGDGVLDAGEMADLGTLGGATSCAWGINDSGMVTGYAETASGDFHAFIYSDLGGMVDLGTLGGSDSYAYGINAAGHVVGMSYTAEGEKHAFVWDGIGMMDLNEMMPSSSEWELTIAWGINDLDEFCGWGYLDGERQGYAMTHTPEPATVLLLGSGLAGLVLRRKRNS